jgi:hypothetical protein
VVKMDIYEIEELEEQLEGDMIDEIEEGFMLGYVGA